MASTTGRQTLPMYGPLLLLVGVIASIGLGQPLVPQFGHNDAADMLTPRNRRVQSLLEQARRGLDDPAGNHRESIESLQRIIDNAEDAFVDAQMVLSVQQVAQQVLSELTDDQRRLYEETYGLEATSLLDTANEQDDSRLRHEVVRRFFHTQVGGRAAYAIAAAEMDRGRLLSAGRLLDRFRTTHTDADRFEPQLTTRAVLCFWQAGDAARAGRIVKEAVRERPELTIAGLSVPPIKSRVAAVKWLSQQFDPPSERGRSSTRDWLLSQGTPDRRPSVDPVSPLFDDAWVVPLIRDNDAREPLQIEAVATLLEGVVSRGEENNWKTIPVLSPLIVGGTVVFPSYGHVKSVDAVTGRLNWVSLPADETFAEPFKPGLGRRNNRLSQSGLDDFLAQRAWRDATSAQLSSDGERVYVVRDSGMVGGLPPNYSRVASPSHPRRPKSYNSLRAYDAVGGNWKWEIGGERTRNALTLAGTFFLGPPLPSEGVLYVLGEDLGQVRLHALDPQTGDLQWSLPLANAERDIEDAVDRRLAGLSPSASGGLLLCPTGSGLLIAVDPRSRSLVWGTRYRDAIRPQRRQIQARMFGRQAGMAQTAELDELLEQDRWHGPSLMIADGRILFAPPDRSSHNDPRRLMCLDLLDGSTLWQRAAEGMLMLGGVHHETVLLIGDRTAEGIRLTNGRPLWSLTVPPPSGTGVLSGSRFHLPTATGGLITLDVDNGKLLAQSSTRSGQTLGNLIAANGRLISQSATEVRGFRTRDVVQQQLASELAVDPDNMAALAARGESRLHDGDTSAGLDDLRRVSKIADDERSRNLIVSTLLAGLKSDFAAHRQHAEELEQLTRSGQQHQEFLLVYAEQLLEAGDREAAFEQFLRLLSEMDDPPPFDDRVSDDEGVSRLVRRDRRVLGHLARLYEPTTGGDRDRLDTLLNATIQQTAPPRQRRLREQLALAIHSPSFDSLTDPLTDPRDKSLIADLSSADLLRWESRLLDLRHRGNLEQQATASARLVELYAVHHQGEEIVQLLSELDSHWAETVVSGEQTGAQFAATVRQRDEVVTAIEQVHDWPIDRIDIEETSLAKAGAFFPLRSEGPLDPLVGASLFIVDGQGRILIQDGDGVHKKAAPIAEGLGVGPNGLLSYLSRRGHRALVYSGTSYALLDMFGKTPRVLSHGSLVIEQQEMFRGFGGGRVVPGQPRFRGKSIVSNGARIVGNVGPIGDSLFCTRVMTTLQAYDPYTGQRLWTTEGVPDDAEIFSDDEYVVLVSPGRSECHVYRAIDGESLGRRRLPRQVIRDRRGADWGRLFLCRYDEDAQPRIAMFDPATQTTVWERVVSPETLWAPRDGRDICLFDDDGTSTIVDGLTGKELFAGKIALPNGLIDVTVVTRPDQWLVLTHGAGTDADEEGIPQWNRSMATPINGPVTAIDRRTGKIQWTRTIRNQLPKELPGRWPVLPLTMVTVAPDREPLRETLILNRYTGDVIHQSEQETRNRVVNMLWRVSPDVPQLSLQVDTSEFQIGFSADDPEPQEIAPNDTLDESSGKPPDDAATDPPTGDD